MLIIGGFFVRRNENRSAWVNFHVTFLFFLEQRPEKMASIIVPTILSAKFSPMVIHTHKHMYVSIPTHLRAQRSSMCYVSLNSFYIHDKRNFGDVLFHSRNIAVSCDGLLNVYRMRQI